MKQDSNLSPETQKVIAERSAARMLMEQWVKENVSEVAHALMELCPFICSECTRADLQKALNTVNITFATVALEVIKSRNEVDEEKECPRCLPADAMEMENALYDLSRFLKMFSAMGHLMEINNDTPAFRMSIALCDKVDSI